MERILRAKSMTGTDGGDDLLSDCPSLGDMLERFLHVLGDELVHEATSDGNHGNDRGHGQGEFPLPGVCDDETDGESSQEIGCHWDLLGNTLLYKV